MATKRLSQIIATEATIKGASMARITSIHKANQRPELFQGLTKTYKPLSEEGETLPDDIKRVQATVETQLEDAVNSWREFFDITLAKDTGNAQAKATVTIDGITLLENVPVVYLLFVEKRLQDVKAFIEAIPILDEAHAWTKVGSLYHSDATKTHRTKKNQKAIVLYPHSDKHPAQTQLITEDEVVGYYTTVHTSGAVPGATKKRWLSRCQALMAAVKEAREGANIQTVEIKDNPGKAILGYVFEL